MTDNNPLTKDDLTDVLAEFFHGRLKPEFETIDEQFVMVNKRFDKVESRLDKVDNRLSNVETELMGAKDEIRGLKADLSVTLTRKEFGELKTKVYRHHPLN